MESFRFTKMHGLGDDFIVVSLIDNTISSPEEAAKQYCDRHFGIGANGLVLVDRSDVADIKMKKINIDGSEAEMCGNAIRCAAKYSYESNIYRYKTIRVETLAGIKTLELNISQEVVETVTVNMGAPIFQPDEIPVKSLKDKAIDETLTIDGQEYVFTAVSMGNPHAVIFDSDISRIPIANLGPRIEHHCLFPNRTNVEFVQIINRNNIKIIVSERAAGPTLACGTGASASLVASVLHNYTDRKVNVEMPGGTLQICWDEKSNNVFMTGKAETVYQGIIINKQEEKS